MALAAILADEQKFRIVSVYVLLVTTVLFSSFVMPRSETVVDKAFSADLIKASCAPAG